MASHKHTHSRTYERADTNTQKHSHTRTRTRTNIHTHRVGACAACTADGDEGTVTLRLEVVHAQVAVLDVVQLALVCVVGRALALQLENNHAPARGWVGKQLNQINSAHAPRMRCCSWAA